MRETVVVGYDGQEHAERALELAIEMVKDAGGKVIVVVAEDVPPGNYESSSAFTSYDPSLYGTTPPIPMPPPSLEEPLPGARDLIDRAVEKVKAAGVPGESAWGVGDPAQVIVDAAQEHGASKIVLGAHHHGLFGRFFEDVASEVRRAAPCEVIVVE